MNTPGIAAGDIMNLVASMVVVVGLVVLLGWAYSRFRFSAGAAGDVIKVVASRAVGSKERIVLVDVGQQQLLLGVTAMQIQTLHAFGSPVVEIPDAVQSAGFASRLRAAMRRTGQ
jgi:flagellar protein FliO/FliZ